MSHRVTLHQSEVGFEAAPAESILSAGLRAGLALPYGCRSGTCASCRVRLVSGEVQALPDNNTQRALSAAELAAGYILMCQSAAASDVTLRLHQPAGIASLRPRTLPARVQEHRMLSADVVGLWLKLPQGAPFDYLPGQYVDFLLEDGMRRSFSIAGTRASDQCLEFHLRVAPGGLFGHYVQDDMPDRALLKFEGPLGAFYLREDSERPVILAAGGTGFAPMKAILERALAKTPQRPFHLYWGARSREDLYLTALPKGWAETYANFRYTPVLDVGDADWDSATGFVQTAVLQDYPDLQGMEAYLAGPPAMVHAGKAAFINAGLDADHLFYDSFDYAYDTWPG